MEANLDHKVSLLIRWQLDFNQKLTDFSSSLSIHCIHLTSTHASLISSTVSSTPSSMQVSLDPEGTLELQVLRDRVLMEAGVRTVFQGVLEPRASLERYWEPHLEVQDRTVYQESTETRASPGHLDHLDYLVGLRRGVLHCYVLKSGPRLYQ